MKDSRAHDDWMDAALAERLLDAEPIAGADGRADALARALAVAAAPLPGDPERERAALAAFREARDATSGDRGKRRARGARPTRRVKAVLGGLAAVFALGGVAVAAQSGTLPGPFHSGTDGPRPVAPAASSSAPAGPGAGRPTAPPRGPQDPGGATPTPDAPRDAHGSVPPLVPSADTGLKGLCQAYVRATEHDRTVNASALTRLEQAAGGSAAVPAYCARLTGAPVVTAPPARSAPAATTPPVPSAPADSGHRK
ncbi:hypothetical protein [Streptomyces sp. NPDC001070]